MHYQDCREENSNPWWQTILERWCQGEMASQQLFQPIAEPLESNSHRFEMQHKI